MVNPDSVLNVSRKLLVADAPTNRTAASSLSYSRGQLNNLLPYKHPAMTRIRYTVTAKFDREVALCTSADAKTVAAQANAIEESGRATKVYRCRILRAQRAFL